MACRMVDATRATIIRQTAFCGNTGTAEKSNVVLRRSKTENSLYFSCKIRHKSSSENPCGA